MQILDTDVPSLSGLAEQSSATGQNAQTAAWRSGLKPASFRGVKFYVVSDEQEGGRRGVTHEFPARDIPYTEDMGRKAKSYTVEGYVIGDDYMAKRDALLEACDAAGPGELVVPWMPPRQVLCMAVRKREEDKAGGMARFSFTFAEAGKEESPTATAIPGVGVEKKADEAMKAVRKVLDGSITVAGVPLPVAEDTLNAVLGLGKSISGVRAISALGAGIPGALARLETMAPAELALLAPSELTSPFFALDQSYSALTSAYGSADPGSSRELALRADAMLGIASQAPSVTVPEGAGTVRATAAENRVALAEYQRNAAVIEAARSMALVRPESKQEAASMRVRVVQAFDDAQDASTDPDVYSSLSDLRSATVRALTESAGTAPEATTVRSQAVRPALALAQRFVVAPGYGDESATEADNILKRNRVRHPGFVSAGEVEVLRAV